jgi:hypothetical protein
MERKYFTIFFTQSADVLAGVKRYFDSAPSPEGTDQDDNPFILSLSFVKH